ncbi:Small ribosomal subunit biogenesis GTPase RsgA [Sphingobium sp. AntQ-1]|uniref:ribosome small subunit-dependent GTPase A n=1 Tax=Sphingobium sp. AntQ-1 TaxID=2930091 RepID=UPI00234F0FF4|nr:ribosome small subunit-dependent GTPase A [Sphingobium sp. AntQ-1]WCP14929.1 Small ribosomal subunit biogenesis GTPase RsgA [Sphingobium sp. AntQ-1]
MNQTLEELGWRPFFSTQLSGDQDPGCHPARVMAVHRGKIAVAGAGATRLIPPYIPDASVPEDHPTVGDWLLIDDATLAVRRVLQRENLFKRRAPGNEQKTQLIAANVDTLFIVASCNKDFSAARLERYLVLAQEVGVQPVVILTKTDLTNRPDIFAAEARDLRPGLLVEAVNGRDSGSVAPLAIWCGRGQTVALVGSSGVGKSTLVNSLRGSDSIMTQAIRKGDDTGRHTTTVREMHRLAGGGWLLDTPGMRELQLRDAGSGIAEIFDDFVEVAEHCRFSNCTHELEPGCAVRTAIADGRLSSARLDRWRRLASEEIYNRSSLTERRALDRIAKRNPAKKK